MLPDRLNDSFTQYSKLGKQHTISTHLGCVSLRLLLGLLIYFKVQFFKNILFILIISSLIIIFFSYKLSITNNKTWKVYIRTLIIYSTILIINILDKYIYNTYDKQERNISGLLIIIDSLMGLQSRHIQNNFKE